MQSEMYCADIKQTLTLNKVIWLEDNNVFVIRKGKTSNKKIGDGNELVQTYTFSKDQWLPGQY